MIRNRLSLAIGLTLFIGAAHVQAQDAGETAKTEKKDEAATLDSIEVTARRRTESLQKVPVAVTAFTEDGLRELQASNIDGLQGAVPNLNIVQGRGSSNSVNAFIRGIGQPDALQTFDPGVGMYVDDVYYSRINGAMFSLFDVSRVEVLRGPQGTLYGKNSTGGAIKVITKDPGDATEGAVEITAGDNGRAEGRFFITTPMSDKASISLAAAKITRDGYINDPVTNKDYNDEDTEAARIKLALHPSDDFSAVFSVDYTHQDNALTLGRPTAPLVRTDFALGAVTLLTPPLGDYNYQSRTSFGSDKGQQMTHWGAAGTLSWNVTPEWLIKSISSYRELETASFIDIDASQFELGDVFVGLNQHQFSQELQFQYDNDSNFQATYGLYYLQEKVPSHQEAYADDLISFFGAPVSFLRTIDDDLQTTSEAAFAHINWELSQGWILSAGIRYTRETKDYDRSTSTFWGPPLGAFSGTFAFTAKDSWTAITPSFSLKKEFSDKTMAYFSANRGFKSGGFNGRANSPGEVSSFDPEFVWTYELGLKTQSEDGRFQGNAAVFHSDYRDFQARVSEVTNPGAPIPNFTFPVLNAGKLAINGIEFEGVALVGDNTRFTAQAAWLDASYEEFIDPRVVLNPALASLHEHVPFSPEFTARLAATHSFNLASGSMLTLGGDLSYRSETWLSVDNRPELRQGAYTLAGLFGTYDSADRNWQIRAGVRNLTNTEYKTDAQEFSSVGNIQTVYYGMPRNWYASFRYNF
ncbi:MAG TPA: TonB-dependent receptor [Arenimonas sp.]|nr:TonB-dependent receptor [Arenimonas sp.]